MRRAAFGSSVPSCAEVHADWLEDHRYLNMDYLKGQKKDLVTAA